MAALHQFILGSIGISFSGAVAPGPMTAVIIGRGTSSPHAGALLALGHGAVEIPLMATLFFGAGYIIGLPHVRTAIALAGGLFLLYMGAGMFKAIGKPPPETAPSSGSPLVSGMVLSIANPYFLIWWATAGMALLTQAQRFGVAGLALFASAHWLCDFVWFYFLSAMSFRGGRFFGKRFRQVIFTVSAALLVFFGVKFIAEGLQSAWPAFKNSI